MCFSENLIKLRKGKGWSQEDLADKLDISRQAVSKWEVGMSKPDIDNLIKLSKLFSKPIDDLVNNKIVHTEAMSIVVKKRDFKQDLLLWLRGLIVLLVVLLVIDTIYKFTMLFIITMGEQKYKELDNYHYVVTKYGYNGLIESEESWYKEGVSKTININYSNNTKDEKMTYIDYINKEGYIIDQVNNVKTNINVNDYILFFEGYNRGGQLFYNFPEEIRRKDFGYLINKAVMASSLDIDTLDDKIFLNIDDKYITLQDDTLLPISMSWIENDNDEYLVTYFVIELNSVESIKI